MTRETTFDPPSRRSEIRPQPSPIARTTLFLAAVLAAAACSASPTGSSIAIAPTTAVAPSTSTFAVPGTNPVVTSTATSSPMAVAATPIPVAELELVAYPVPSGSRPHDVAPEPDGGVWYTAQGSGDLGWLDPVTGDTRHIDLGPDSRPHGVIVGPAGAAWITDGGRNSIIRVDPESDEITEFPLPPDRPDANLNTAAFDGFGRLWFTGQNGIHGVLDPASGAMEVFDSPRGRGPYGITSTPAGTIYFASLAGSYVGFVATDGSVTVLEPPTPSQGARRVWSDSAGSIWVSEWNSGQLSRYVPLTGAWTTWPLPGSNASAYAVYVDDTDIVWVSDFGGNGIHRFDSVTERFHTFALPSNPGNVRQILGRPGEVWAPESAADQLVVIRRAGG